MALTELFTNIANAIRAKSGGSAKIKPTDFASQISSLSTTPILLGTSTSFNVKSLVPSVDYTKLTADNFFIQTIVNQMEGAHTEQSVYSDRSNGNYGVEIQKSYNSSTGVLTCQIHGANFYQDSNGNGANNWNKYCACKVYLIEKLS